MTLRSFSSIAMIVTVDIAIDRFHFTATSFSKSLGGGLRRKMLIVIVYLTVVSISRWVEGFPWELWCKVS